MNTFFGISRLIIITVCVTAQYSMIGSLNSTYVSVERIVVVIHVSIEQVVETVFRFGMANTFHELNFEIRFESEEIIHDR
jgi:hypothetical protein